MARGKSICVRSYTVQLRRTAHQRSSSKKKHTQVFDVNKFSFDEWIIRNFIGQLNEDKQSQCELLDFSGSNSNKRHLRVNFLLSLTHFCVWSAIFLNTYLDVRVLTAPFHSIFNFHIGFVGNKNRKEREKKTPHISFVWKGKQLTRMEKRGEKKRRTHNKHSRKKNAEKPRIVLAKLIYLKNEIYSFDLR